MAYALTYPASCSLALSRPATNSATGVSMARSSADMFVAAMDSAGTSAPMSIRRTWSPSGKAWLAGGVSVMILPDGRRGRIFTQSQTSRCPGLNPNRSSRLLLAGLSNVDLMDVERELATARTVLAWYANAANYRPPARVVDKQRRDAPVIRDGGSRARKILAHLPKGRHDDSISESSRERLE